MSSMTVARRAGGVVVAVGVLWLLARASAFPLPYHDANASRLRLSWSARPERIEQCRALSEEEIAKQPSHMRRRMECSGVFASYRLEVSVDGRELDERTVRGGGLRHDRAMHVLEEYDVPPGPGRIRVMLKRIELNAGSTDTSMTGAASAAPDTGIYAGRAEREVEERERRRRAAVPAELLLDTAVTIHPGTVRLVTFDPEARRLVLRRSPATAPDRGR